MKSLLSALLLTFLVSLQLSAQVVLESNGAGETYELINSVLAPGADVVEVPDCSHDAFGRHIDEVFDNELNKNVFRFIIHTTPDDDRCKNFDRQRNEIKTYDQSPDNLKAVKGERVEYKWKFKIDANFQPSSSFTHLHQIKAVDGPEDGMPSITFTARKGSPDKLELRYAEALSQTTIHEINLSLIKDHWVEVTETILFGEKGESEYNMEIKKVSDGTTVMSYSSDNLRMWKTDASFLRPKWGIYRSLNDVSSLRDEEVLFADFQIQELNVLTINTMKQPITLNPNPFQESIQLSNQFSQGFSIIEIYDSGGKSVLSKAIVEDTLDVSFLKSGLFVIVLKGKNGTPISYKMIKK